VFIPLLFMGGIVGRMFREFALTVTASVLVSAVVSLTLAPMLCSRFLRHSNVQGRLYRGIEAVFNAMLAGYRATLNIVLRHQAITLLVFFFTLGATIVLMIQIPKGFVPIQDTGLIQGVAEAGQDVSSEEMQRLQRVLGEIILRDPNVAGFNSQTASTGGNRKHRALHHCPEAPRTTFAHCIPDYQSSAAGDCKGRRRQSVSAGNPGHNGRRPCLSWKLPVHAAECRRQ
jgi:HAE1 family hydrophobic/amphiphilic exporter-1